MIDFKQGLVIISFLFCFLTVSGQDYFIDFDNLTWKEAYAPVPTRNIHYVFSQGDSIINGKEYDLLYRQFVCTYTPFPDPIENCNVGPPNLHAGIRQETGKVYAIELDTNSSYYNQEYLLMDFNLEVGDTMYITEDKMFFIKVYEITYSNDGRKIINCFLSNFFFGDSPYVKWIEGIGSNISLKYFIGPPHWSSTCFKLDGEYIEGIGGFGCPCEDCLEESTNTNEETKDEFYLYPNPSMNEFNLAGIQGENIVKYEIIDLNGNSYSSKVTSFDKLKYNVRDLKPQLYFIKLFLDNNQSRTVKFIKI